MHNQILHQLEHYRVLNLGNISGVTAIDYSLGTYIAATQVGNILFTFTNPPASGTVGRFELELTNGGVTATAGTQTVNVGGAKTNASASGLAADVPATAGYQVVNVGGAKVGGGPTGLANDATVYTVTVTIDATGGNFVKSVNITGSTAQTYTTLLSEINTDLGVNGTATLDAGNIKITSATTGATSSVAITADTLFSVLPGYVEIPAAVAGAAINITTYTATIVVDSAGTIHTQSISIAGGTAFPTYGDIISALTAQSGGFYTVTALGAGNNIIITSATTGANSSINITDGGTPLFATLTDFVEIQAAIAGIADTITWPGSVKWAGGAPTLTASGTDILTFRTRDGGTTWYGSTQLAFV
jgi:hypothetical protein